MDEALETRFPLLFYMVCCWEGREEAGLRMRRVVGAGEGGGDVGEGGRRGRGGGRGREEREGGEGEEGGRRGREGGEREGERRRTSEYSIFESPHSLDSFLLTTFSSCLQCLPLFLCLHYHLVPQDLLLDLLQVCCWEGGRREGWIEQGQEGGEGREEGMGERRRGERAMEGRRDRRGERAREGRREGEEGSQ